jgi:acetoin utilization protein AcuB
MRVKEWMSTSPTTTGPQTSVSEARELMRRKVIRHLLITEGERLVGIVTDRDIRLNLPSPATSLSVWEINYLLTKLTVGDVMTKAVITVEPKQPIEEAARLMLEHRIGALPVADDGRLAGILTETDLLRAFVYSQSAAAPAVGEGSPVAARG